MEVTDEPAAVRVKGKYRVYRMPAAARAMVAGRPPGETIRAFVGRTVSERLPALVEALNRLGVEAPGPSRPLRLPVTPELLGRLGDAGRATGLPASRLLLLVLTAPAPTAEPEATVPQKVRPGGRGKGAGGKPRKRAKTKSAAPAGRGRRTKPDPTPAPPPEADGNP